MKDSLPDENAAKDRFLIGVFLDARRDKELNQDALFVRRVPMRKDGSFRKRTFIKFYIFWFFQKKRRSGKEKFSYKSWIVRIVDLHNSINQKCPRKWKMEILNCYEYKMFFFLDKIRTLLVLVLKQKINKYIFLNKPVIDGIKKNRSAENPRNFVRKSLIKTKLRHV